MNLLEIPELVRPFLPLIQIAFQLVGAVIAVLAARRAWRWLRAQPLEDRLTVVAASIATSVSAQGMWRFTGDVLGLDGLLRVGLFAFIEVAVVTSAVRAKRSMRENYSAGIDGIAVWVLAALTAVLSSLDSRSFGEVVFRLAAPLVSAWMWERGMRLERRRLRGLSGINWRITPERILVRLGLAEASDRTASEVDAQRRITRLALAAKRARQLRDMGASDRKQRAALARLDKAFERAAEHTGLGRDTELQERVRDEVAALYSAGDLMDIPAASAWTPAPEEQSSLDPAPARRVLVFRTETRTDPTPAAVRLSRSFTFAQRPAEEPVRVLRRAFAFQPTVARTDSVRRVLVFRTRLVTAVQEHLDRPVFVREITADLLSAVERGDKWMPDYDALMARSGRKRSWCEKAVSDARKAVFRTETRTDEAAA